MAKRGSSQVMGLLAPWSGDVAEPDAVRRHGLEWNVCSRCAITRVCDGPVPREDWGGMSPRRGPLGTRYGCGVQKKDVCERASAVKTNGSDFFW